MSDLLKGKNYEKPKGNQIFRDPGHVQSIGDLIPLENWKGFILGENRDAGTPNPGYLYLAISDARVFAPGDRILIDCVNNTSALRIVQKVDGRVIILKDRLNHLPLVGGDVFKIIGQSSTQIDTRWDLSDPNQQMRFLQQNRRKI